MSPGEARALAAGRRAELLRRARKIRRAVAAGATALFIAVFLVVYVQLASGHDPALSASSKARTTTTSSGSGASTTPTQSSGEESQSSESTSPMTTSQS
jgi:hypothetical protein